MHLLNLLTTLAPLTGFTLAAPTGEINLKSLNFPADNLTAMLDSMNTASELACPKANVCGIFIMAVKPPAMPGRTVSFGEGICIPIPPDAYTVEVKHCFCSLWSACHSGYVDGMAMCQKPMVLWEYPTRPKYISCGGGGLTTTG